MFIVPAIAVLLLGQASSVPSTASDAPVLQVGVFSYTADDRIMGSAYTTSLSRGSFQYVTGCGLGSGNRPVPDAATDAWRISGSVQSISADEAIIQLDWQRIRTNRVAVSSPGGSVQLTLHPGDRVPLDSANRDSVQGCSARFVGLEARFGPRPFAVNSGIGGSGGGVSVGTRVGRGQGVSGNGGGVRAETGAASNNGGAQTAGQTAIASAKPAIQGSGQAREYDADLWLVRTDKGHPENPGFNLQGLILQRIHGTAEFAFSPFTIDSSAGPLNVQIAGSLRVTTENDPSLIFTTTRTIRYSPAAPGRDAPSSATGTSTTTNPLPGPDDVLSFELPPIRVPNSKTALPDQYSVRVRIR